MLIIPLLNDYILVYHPDMYCMHLHLLYVLYKIPHFDCLWNHVLVCITLLHCYPLLYGLYGIPHFDCLWNHVLVCITLLHCYPLLYDVSLSCDYAMYQYPLNATSWILYLIWTLVPSAKAEFWITPNELIVTVAVEMCTETAPVCVMPTLNSQCQTPHGIV